MSDLDLIYCERCDMSINLAGGRHPVCPGCGLDNSHQVLEADDDGYCDECFGTGLRDGEECPFCHGTGFAPVLPEDRGGQ